MFRLVSRVLGLVVALGLVLGGCGGGGGDGVVVLVRGSSGDLYVGEAGGEIGRDHRVARDLGSVEYVSVERDGVWSWGQLVDVGGELVLVARGPDSFGLWAVDGDEFLEVVSESEGISAAVAGGALYVRETREGSQRCYRGSAGELDNLERVFRGDFCVVTKSGHIMGADASGEQVRVRVWPPGGDEEVLRADFDTRPEISDNGLFLVSRDGAGVTVTSVESGDQVWDLDGAVDYDMMSHPDGYVALAVNAEGGDVVLVLVKADGDAIEVAEVAEGEMVATFAASGDLVWLHTTSDDVGKLFSWSRADGEEQILADEEGLELVGVHEDSAITAINDEFGALYQRFPLNGSSDTELHEFEDDTVVFASIHGDHLYVAGREKASVVPLTGGDPIDSEPWDQITTLDATDGTLVAAGQDGSSQVLFSITVGTDGDVEYDQYDDVNSAQVYNNTLYASVTDNNDTDTIAFDLKTGDRKDDNDHLGYRLINTRQIADTQQIHATATVSPPEPEYDETREPQVADAPIGESDYYTTEFDARFLRLGETVNEGIDYQGEIDRYVFPVHDSLGVSMWTSGSTDTFARLYEVDDSGSRNLIEENDDGGEDTNSQLDVYLVPGWYLLEISGYDDTITGDYRLFLNSNTGRSG